MKIFLSLVVGVIGSALLIWGDVLLVKHIISLVPDGSWSGLVKVCIIFADILFTSGVCVLPFLLGGIIGFLLEGDEV